jgi:dihydrodipicolinate synthase/N-acetylneuraminate lyase
MSLGDNFNPHDLPQENPMSNPVLFQTPLRGIIPPLVTPLSDRDTIDESGLARLIEHVIAGGVSGIFILGTTGEAPSLSYRLRREFIRLVTGMVNGRVPVLVGITDTAFVESIALAQVARESGAAAVVLSTPYYFPAGQTELSRYVDRVIEQLPLPLVLYNMPSLTKVWFDIDTVRELSRHEQIVGVKDSSGDLQYFEKLVSLKSIRPDWTIMIGPEAMLPEAMALGGDGGVSGGANVYPNLFVDCFQAIVAEDSDRVARLMKKILRLQDIYDVGKYASRFIKATKCALSLHDICSDHMAEPFNHFLAPERERVRAILDDINA